MKARIACLGLLVLLPLAEIPAADQDVASPQNPDVSRTNGLALVQSELDFLEARDLQVTLNFKEVRPSKIFAAVKDAAGIEIQYRGRFSDTTRVTIALDKVTLKTALKELARQLDIYYQVPEPGKLVIVVGEKNRHPG
jgi:hypothetical protein